MICMILLSIMTFQGFLVSQGNVDQIATSNQVSTASNTESNGTFCSDLCGCLRECTSDVLCGCRCCTNLCQLQKASEDYAVCSYGCRKGCCNQFACCMHLEKEQTHSNLEDVASLCKALLCIDALWLFSCNSDLEPTCKIKCNICSNEKCGYWCGNTKKDVGACNCSSKACQEECCCCTKEVGIWKDRVIVHPWFRENTEQNEVVTTEPHQQNVTARYIE